MISNENATYVIGLETDYLFAEEGGELKPVGVKVIVPADSLAKLPDHIQEVLGRNVSGVAKFEEDGTINLKEVMPVSAD